MSYAPSPVPLDLKSLLEFLARELFKIAAFLSPDGIRGLLNDLPEETLASAGTTTLTQLASVYRITGATTINILTPQTFGAPVIHLLFTTSVTVNDESTAAGNIRLSAGANFAATADDVLTLLWNATDAAWHEVSRSVN